MTLVANLPSASLIPVAICLRRHTGSGVDTGSNFAACVVDTGGKFATGVVDTGGNFAAGVVDTGGKFATGDVDTGGAPCLAIISANFRKNLKRP